MSEKQSEQLVDYSSYDGSYQEGELLGEDGQAIDLDELKQAEKPPQTPLLIRLLFIIFTIGLGGLTYAVFMRQPPPPPPPPPPTKADTFYDSVLSRLEDARTKDFRPVRDCWAAIARAQAGTQKLNPASLQKACPPFQAETVSYQGACADDTCKEIKLQRCKDKQCTDIPDAAFLDFLYATMQRYAEGYNYFYAHQKIYGIFREKLNDKKREAKRSKQEESPELKEMLEKEKTFAKGLRRFLQGEGFDPASLTTPYFSLKRDDIFTQVLQQIQNNSKTLQEEPKEETAPPPRRRGRRAAKKAKAAPKKKAPLSGGILYMRRSWPTETEKILGYKTLTKYFRLEDRADAIGQLRYTPTALRFWTHDALQHSLHLCAARHANDQDKTLTLNLILLNKTGFPKPEEKTLAPATNQALHRCILEAVQQKLVYRALPAKGDDGKDIEETPAQIHFSVIP